MRFQRLPNDGVCDGSWGARTGKWTFVIAHIEELGFTASWKNREFMGVQPSNPIGDWDKPFQKFSDAERACNETAKQLKVMA
jgi:hypothetical protein